jgi:trimeric autotransporter adhesin
MNGDGRPDLVFVPENTSITLTVNGVAVLLNTTPAGFALSAAALNPGTVTAGSSATSTVTVTPTFGYDGAEPLSCTGLPTGATCAFNPPSIANSSGTSTLTITTNASLAASTYSVQVQGSSGSIVNSVPVSLVVQAAPDFTIGAGSGSPTSQTISAGQTASFSLAFAPTGSFSGTVNLSCAITPTLTPAPTCALSSSTMQLSGSGMQTVTVKVATIAPATSGVVPHMHFPAGPTPLLWMSILLGSAWIWMRNRKRVPALAPIAVLALAYSVGCGGGGSSSTHTAPGTPAGSYTATITASSGITNHNMALQVVVR